MSRDQDLLHKYFLGSYDVSIIPLGAVIILAMLFKVDALVKVCLPPPPKKVPETNF